MPSHQHLMKLMTSLKFGDPEGVCAGITEMGISEFLSGDFDRFCKRLDSLEKIDPEVLAKKNKALFSKLFIKNKKYQSLKLNEKHESLSPEEIKELADTIAFFEGVKLYLEPSEHTGFFNQYISQEEPSKISPLVETKKLVSKGRRVEITSLYGIYNPTELNQYFLSLENAINTNPPPVNFALSLGSDNHSIGLCYF